MANLVKYEAKDGQSVELSFEAIKKYLVHGKPEYVTNQEMIFFMGICKSRGLNPFAKDCYLMKYSFNDPAAIIVSIDYYRARARSQKDCKGWEAGIIVEDENGNLRYSKGLVRKDETLLGGWFKAKPDGWDYEFEIEVNLDGYIKKTKQGDITKFWKKEKQPTMIRKVAESQGLRELWPDEFAKLYVEEEVDRTEMRDSVISLDLDKSDEATENGKDIYGVKETPEKTEKEKTAVKLEEANERLKEKREELGVETEPDKPTLYEKLKAARSNFCDLVRENGYEIEKLPEDEQAYLKNKWEGKTDDEWPLIVKESDEGDPDHAWDVTIRGFIDELGENGLATVNRVIDRYHVKNYMDVPVEERESVKRDLNAELDQQNQE